MYLGYFIIQFEGSLSEFFKFGLGLAINRTHSNIVGEPKESNLSFKLS